MPLCSNREALPEVRATFTSSYKLVTEAHVRGICKEDLLSKDPSKFEHSIGSGNDSSICVSLRCEQRAVLGLKRLSSGLYVDPIAASYMHVHNRHVSIRLDASPCPYRAKPSPRQQERQSHATRRGAAAAAARLGLRSVPHLPRTRQRCASRRRAGHAPTHARHVRRLARLLPRRPGLHRDRDSLSSHLNLLPQPLAPLLACVRLLHRQRRPAAPRRPPHRHPRPPHGARFLQRLFRAG